MVRYILFKYIFEEIMLSICQFVFHVIVSNQVKVDSSSTALLYITY